MEELDNEQVERDGTEVDTGNTHWGSFDFDDFEIDFTGNNSTSLDNGTPQDVKPQEKTNETKTEDEGKKEGVGKSEEDILTNCYIKNNIVPNGKATLNKFFYEHEINDLDIKCICITLYGSLDFKEAFNESIPVKPSINQILEATLVPYFKNLANKDSLVSAISDVLLNGNIDQVKVLKGSLMDPNETSKAWDALEEIKTSNKTSEQIIDEIKNAYNTAYSIEDAKKSIRESSNISDEIKTALINMQTQWAITTGCLDNFTQENGKAFDEFKNKITDKIAEKMPTREGLTLVLQNVSTVIQELQSVNDINTIVDKAIDILKQNSKTKLEIILDTVRANGINNNALINLAKVLLTKQIKHEGKTTSWNFNNDVLNEKTINVELNKKIGNEVYNVIKEFENYDSDAINAVIPTLNQQTYTVSELKKQIETIQSNALKQEQQTYDNSHTVKQAFIKSNNELANKLIGKFPSCNKIKKVLGNVGDETEFDNKVALYSNLDSLLDSVINEVNITQKAPKTNTIDASFKGMVETVEYTYVSPYELDKASVQQLSGMTLSAFSNIIDASTEGELKNELQNYCISLYKSMYGQRIKADLNNLAKQVKNEKIAELKAAYLSEKAATTTDPVEKSRLTNAASKLTKFATKSKNKRKADENKARTATHVTDNDTDIVGVLDVDGDEDIYGYESPVQTSSYDRFINSLNSMEPRFQFGNDDEVQSEYDDEEIGDIRETYPVVYMAIEQAAANQQQADEAKSYVDTILSNENANPVLAEQLKNYNGDDPKLIRRILQNHTSSHTSKQKAGPIERDQANTQMLLKKDMIANEMIIPGDAVIKNDPEIWNKAIITEFGYPFINYGNGLIQAILHKSEDPAKAKEAYKRLKQELYNNASAVPYEVRDAWDAIADNPIKLLKEFASPGKESIHLNVAMVNADEFINSEKTDIINLTPISTSSIEPEEGEAIGVTRSFILEFYNFLKIDSTPAAMDLYLKYCDMDINDLDEYLEMYDNIPPIYILVPKKASYKMVTQQKSWFGKLMGLFSSSNETVLVSTSCMGQNGGFIIPKRDIDILFSTFTRK